jgi:tRNA threonylcarbamoyladenosine biosynthesis protein TsaE
MPEYLSTSAAETMLLGEICAEKYLEPGTVIALFGDLGAGKTQFVKGIARACGIPERDVTSPTFALANEFSCVFPDDGPGTLFHLDCYRFEKPEELIALGIEDYLQPKNAATVIEWADRIQKYLPRERIDVQIWETGPDARTIVIEEMGTFE